MATKERTVEKRPVLLYNLYRLAVLTSLLVSALIIQLSSPEAQPNLPFYYLTRGGAWPPRPTPRSSSTSC